MIEEPFIKFSALVGKIEDAFKNNFLTGDGVDQIHYVMSALYSCEAKNIALAKGEINSDEDFTPSISIDDLFNCVIKKSQFINELDAVFYHVCKSKMDSRDIVDFIFNLR